MTVWSDPVQEAVDRVCWSWHEDCCRSVAEDAAKEMAKPIRDLYRHWMWSPSQAITGSLEVQEMMKELARLIFTSEELGDSWSVK